jgi:nucleoside-diphosphate-sugar epimerase
MKILITGGAGFIGTHLAERFAPAHEVVLFDNLRRDSFRWTPHLRENPKIHMLQGDVLDAAALEQACRSADVVLHLAAIAGVSSYYKESLRTLQVNILGTVNALEAARKAGVGHFIDFSTSEVFGPDALWVTEESPHGIGPVSERRWVYATSKLASEHFTLRYGEQHGFRATCVRPFNIYGPRQSGEGAISNFCRAAVAGQPVTVYGDGSAIRAWCFISDMVEGVARILDQPDRAAGKTFNIGNPREVETTLGLARRVARLSPGLEIRREDVERSEVRARIPSIDRARAELGFEPAVDLEEGLQRTIAWFKETHS